MTDRTAARVRARGARHLALLMILLVSGCTAMSPELAHRVDEAAAGLVPHVDDDAAVLRTVSSVAEHGPPQAADTPLPDGVTLDEYVAIALRDNPGVRRAIRNVQVLGYEVPQVKSLDDPMINLVPPTNDMTQTAAGMLGGVVSVSEKIPFPGKLATRGRIAEQSVRIALDNLADTRIRTVADVQKAYYGYYLADVSAAITRQSQDLLRQIRDVASARYKSGAATQQDVLRSEVELYTLSDQLITLEQQRTTFAAQLNALMNRAVDAPLPRPQPFDLTAVDWELPQAMAQAVRSSPRLARLQEQIKKDLETIKLARLDYFPDLTTGFTYTFVSSEGISPVATGNDAWNLAFGLNLPIWWQRLRARVLEGNAQALASVEEYTELRNQLSFQIQDALVKIDTQYRRAVLFRKLVVPRARQAVDVATSSYRSGTLDFTALIDNWGAWLDASLSYYRALAELEQRFADLQQLLGVRVARAATHADTSGGAHLHATAASEDLR